MMAQLDYELNNVVNSLKEKNMWEDTIFLFTTDNGGMPVVGGSNYPFRGMKGDAWEGGVRGPAFIKIPTKYNDFNFSKGSCFHGLVHISDWLPTFKGLLKIEGAIFDESLYTGTGIDQTPAFTGSGAQKWILGASTCIIFNQ